MSFFKTQEQFKNESKTVTRRTGWKNIKLGVVHSGIVKGQGLKKGEHVERLGNFIPLISRWEPLSNMARYPAYGEDEVIREGFPNLTPAQFVEMLCDMNRITPATEVNRILFCHTRFYVGYKLHNESYLDLIQRINNGETVTRHG
jgi:hypothetical protein